jgi:hypothetical protein
MHLQAGNLRFLRKGVRHKGVAHGVDAKHPPHSGTAEQAQQQQHHGNGAQHAKTDRELAHQAEN